MSNKGKWDAWYAGLDPNTPTAFRYGDTVTYHLAAEWLENCCEIEDWGCGAGGFKRYCVGKYIGVDGSNTPFADKVVDLVGYTSQAEGILVRHVLEHDYNWRKILQNAAQSFTNRMALVLFTPFSSGWFEKEIAHNLQHGVDVPDLSLPHWEIEEVIEASGARFVYEKLKTDTGYGLEHFFKIWK